uniref:Uncharacterized protein n=1 Tax=Arundo donax TaxID=35708 RepID=A0A0A8Y759_ARUDO
MSFRAFLKEGTTFRSRSFKQFTRASFSTSFSAILDNSIWFSLSNSVFPVSSS